MILYLNANNLAIINHKMRNGGNVETPSHSGDLYLLVVSNLVQFNKIGIKNIPNWNKM